MTDDGLGREIEVLLLQFRSEEELHKKRAAEQAPMGGHLYARHRAKWEMAKQHADDLEATLLRARSPQVQQPEQ